MIIRTGDNQENVSFEISRCWIQKERSFSNWSDLIFIFTTLRWHVKSENSTFLKKKMQFRTNVSYRQDKRRATKCRDSRLDIILYSQLCPISAQKFQSRAPLVVIVSNEETKFYIYPTKWRKHRYLRNHLYDSKSLKHSSQRNFHLRKISATDTVAARAREKYTWAAHKFKPPHAKFTVYLNAPIASGLSPLIITLYARAAAAQWTIACLWAIRACVA